MSEYEYTSYGGGFAIEVEPEDRAADVLHYLITGHLLGGRSLAGVKWKEINEEDYKRIADKRAKELRRSMRECE